MRITRTFSLWTICFFILIVGVIGAFCFFFGAPGSSLTKEKYDRAAKGMTKAEVIAILGKPDTENFKGAITQGTEVWNEGRDPRSSYGAMIQVEFDQEDRSIGKAWFPPQGPRPSLLERIILWFK